MAEPPRRVVTGHAPDGRSVVVEDGPVPSSRTVAGGATFHEIWSTGAAPASLAAVEPDPTRGQRRIPPPSGGSVLRRVDFAPGARSPMHRTESVDYGIVLEGEIHLVLDGEATVLRPGDVVVQRGTNHAWENRGAEPTRMLFILVDGAFADELRELLGDEAELMEEPPAP
jgi:naringenin degradation protein FdeH